MRKPASVKDVIVVDNASTDRTVEIAKSFPDVHVIEESQKGVTSARQRGLREARTDLIAYIDADTRIPDGWFSIMEQEFEHSPELACLSGPCFYDDDLPEWQRKWMTLTWYCIALPTYRLTKGMVIGGNFAVRRTALLDIGGFDMNIDFYGEDANLTRRLSEVGEIRFRSDFYLCASGRRVRGEGAWKAGSTYAINYLSEMILKKPWTETHEDIR